MRNEMPLEDIEFGTAVQKAAKRLKSLLRSGEQRSFEDRAREAITNPLKGDETRVASLEVALKAFQEAVNAFWTHEYCAGFPEWFVQQWAGKNRNLLREVGREELECAVGADLMRKWIISFDPTKGVPFRIYTRVACAKQLTDYAFTQARPVKASRGDGVGFVPRVDLENVVLAAYDTGTE